MTLPEFLSHLEGVKGGGGQYSARCPHHGDAHNSLSVSVGKEGRILLRCHAGCTPEDVTWSMGLTMKDLFAELSPDEAFPTYSAPKTKAPPAQFEAEYIYRDKDGAPILKKIKMREADGGKFCYWMHLKDGEWAKGRNGIAPPLYTTTDGKPLPGGVFLVEGEKDVETLKALGKAAATLPDGAKSKWASGYGEALAGRTVAVIQDNDGPGKEFAQRVAGELRGRASSIKVLDLTQAWAELPEHGDVTDLVQHMGGEAGVLALLKLTKETQEWTPAVEAVSPEKERRPLKIICMTDVEAKRTRWLWYPYIPLGKITLMQGDPGGSKTTLSLAIASIISKGGRFINDEELTARAPAKVIYQTAEDGVDDTIKPRLLKMAPTFENIFLIDERDQGLTLTDTRIEDALKKLRPSLMIIDPLQAYLGADVDMHRANEVRPVMAQIGRLAEEYGCAILFIMHMSKMSGQKALYRGLGSIDFAAVARSVLVVGRNPQNDAEIIMAHEKSSLAKNGQSLVYHIDQETGIVFDGYSELTADDILGPKQTPRGRPGDSLEEAKNLLYEMLGKEGYARRDDIMTAAALQSIGERTVQRAKKELGVWHLVLGRASSRDTWWLMPGVEKEAISTQEKSDSAPTP